MSSYSLGRFNMHGMKRLVSVLDVETDRIDRAVSAGERLRNRLFVMNICFDSLKLPIVTSERKNVPLLPATLPAAGMRNALSAGSWHRRELRRRSQWIQSPCSQSTITVPAMPMPPGAPWIWQ